MRDQTNCSSFYSYIYPASANQLFLVTSAFLPMSRLALPEPSLSLPFQSNYLFFSPLFFFHPLSYFLLSAHLFSASFTDHFFSSPWPSYCPSLRLLSFTCCLSSPACASVAASKAIKQWEFSTQQMRRMDGRMNGKMSGTG